MDTTSASLGMGALLGLAGAASGQGLLWTWPNPPGVNWVAPAGDIDLDGTDDVLFGVWDDSSTLGRVAVRSGRTGAELLAVVGAGLGDDFGYRAVGLGDVDGDGHGDFAVSAPVFGWPNLVPYVRGHSGATGAELWRRDGIAGQAAFGQAIAALSDVDLDGVRDLAVGSPGSPAGEVWIFSGASGATVLAPAAFASTSPGFGTNVASAGDFDADGVGDVLVADNGGSSGIGRTTVHSGSTGAILQVFPDPPAGGGNDRTLAALGDVDGDGVTDYVLGTPNEVIVWGWQTGRVRIVSGASAAELVRIDPIFGQVYLGLTVDRFSDLDGDGRADVLVGCGSLRSGCCAYSDAGVRVYSSTTGASLYQGENSGFVAVLSDVSGDGVADYALAPVHVGLERRAGIAVTHAVPPVYDPACPSLPTSQGCLPMMHATGAPSLTQGEDFALVAPLLPLNTTGLFFWGRVGAQIPFNGLTRCIASPVHRWPVVATPSGQPTPSCTYAGTGEMRMPISKSALAAMGVPPGSTFHAQAWFRDPGATSTNGVRMTKAVIVTIWP